MLPPSLVLAHNTLGREVFKPAMSRDARELLTFIVENINRLGIQQGGINQLLKDFASKYVACTYEDAVLGWQYRDIIKKLRLLFNKQRVPPADILSAACLMPLFNRIWDLNVTPGQQFRFSRSASQTEIYDYLTREWLLDDFSRVDLTNLSEIARRPIESIKDICKKLDRPEQRSISYLYRVVNSEAKQQEVISKNNKAALAKSMEKLNDILFPQRPGVRHHAQQDRSWIEDIEITRKMLETKDD